MNVLLSSAGRRNYLVNYFQDALAGRGEVCVTDASPTASAMVEADRALLVPPVKESGYFDTLLDLCLEHRIGLLLSLNDLELPGMARQRRRFLGAGIQTVISSPKVVDLAADKVATTQFLIENGLAAPKTYVSLPAVRKALAAGRIAFPLVVKARWGSGSIGLEFVDNASQLAETYSYADRCVRQSFLADLASDPSAPCVVVQPRIEGQEYHLDIINDLKGRYRATLAKKKLAMRAGETVKAVTVVEQRFTDLGRRLGEALGHVGVLDCDIMSGPDGDFVIDLNPRFGGGYPFSQIAGANVPAALLAWSAGKEACPEWLQVKPGVMSAKCDRLVVFPS